MAYIVTAPLVIARANTGQLVHVYQGRELPDTIDKDEAERLVKLDMVEKVTDSRKSN